MSIVPSDSLPFLLGGAIGVIILIAFFSKSGDEEVAKTALTVGSAKKGKKSPVAMETVPKKKKPKKKPKVADDEDTLKKPLVTFLQDVKDDESDEDIDLWRIQSATKRKGANDAVKRALANKEKERERALKKQKEKERLAAEQAQKEADAAAEEAAKALAEKEAAEKAALELEKKKGEKKTNGATVSTGKNGETQNGKEVVAGEKKKRKKKKKKATDEEVEEVARKLSPVTAPVEHWETVPVVEEWQEVGHKKGKQKAKVEAAAAASEGVSLNDLNTGVPVLVEEPAEEGEISVSLPAGDDPLIFIGKGGAIIQQLQETTGAKFNLNRTTNVLTISGLQHCVELGVAAARSILSAEAFRKANETTEKVTWGSDAVKAVIGKGGANIKATQEATGVKIDADVEAGTLEITGQRDRVSAALTMCHNAAFGEAQDVLELGSRNAVNIIYGPNFQTIRGLQEETGCKLDIARGSTTLKLSGSNEAVSSALTRVRLMLEQNRGFEMTIENNKVGAVYGKGGEVLRSIQDRTGVHIDVVRGLTHATVSVMGTQEASDRARRMLQRAIDGEIEVGPGEVAESVELGTATAAVIGRGGTNVTEMEKRHGVKINVRSDEQVARIVGRSEKVASAMKDIMAIAKPILDAEQAQKKADEALKSGESAWQVDALDDDADGW